MNLRTTTSATAPSSRKSASRAWLLLPLAAWALLAVISQMSPSLGSLGLWASALNVLTFGPVRGLLVGRAGDYSFPKVEALIALGLTAVVFIEMGSGPGSQNLELSQSGNSPLVQFGFVLVGILCLVRARRTAVGSSPLWAIQPALIGVAILAAAFGNSSTHQLGQNALSAVLTLDLLAALLFRLWSLRPAQLRKSSKPSEPTARAAF